MSTRWCNLCERKLKSLPAAVGDGEFPVQTARDNYTAFSITNEHKVLVCIAPPMDIEKAISPSLAKRCFQIV